MRIRKDVYEKYVETVNAGKLIFSEGDMGESMYIIIDGEVEITKQTSTGSTKTLAVLKKGDIFGEMAIIEDKPRSANASALVKSSLLVMNESLFLSTIETNPDFAKKMIMIMAERIRKANSLIQDLVTTDREKQIFSALNDFAEAGGNDTFKGLRVMIEAFTTWGTQHLGIAAFDIKTNINALVKKGFISYSASGKDAVIIPRKN